MAIPDDAETLVMGFGAPGEVGAPHCAQGQF
jgi:hypothetical protein